MLGQRLRWVAHVRENDAEIIPANRAFAEHHISEDIAVRFLQAEASRLSLPFKLEPRSRIFWGMDLAGVRRFALYVGLNSAKHEDYQVAERSANAGSLVWGLRRSSVARPTEQMQAFRKRLSRAPLDELVDPRLIAFELPNSPITDHYWAAIFTVRPDYLEDPTLRIKRGDCLLAIDFCLGKRSKRGRPQNHQTARVYECLRADYCWLTGERASWTNAEGLAGPLIDFMRKVYAAHGIAAPSEMLLRPPRPRGRN